MGDVGELVVSTVGANETEGIRLWRVTMGFTSLDKLVRTELLLVCEDVEGVKMTEVGL